MFKKLYISNVDDALVMVNQKWHKLTDYFIMDFYHIYSYSYLQIKEFSELGKSIFENEQLIIFNTRGEVYFAILLPDRLHDYKVYGLSHISNILPDKIYDLVVETYKPQLNNLVCIGNVIKKYIINEYLLVKSITNDMKGQFIKSANH